MSGAKPHRRIVKQHAWPSSVRADQRTSVSNPCTLQVAYVETTRLKNVLETSASNLFGLVLYGQSVGHLHVLGTCPTISLDLPQFNDSSLTEVWTSTLPVSYHEAEGIRFAMNEEILFGALQLEENQGTPLGIVTYTAYRRLLLHARSLGYPHLLRVWNYFPGINLESEGLDRYQRFCVGRYEALAESLEDFPRTLPAGTAIGTFSGPLQIHFVAATRPGTHIENPRQMNAYQYPRVYGPRSPSFARATLRRSPSESQLFIAGTASVVGHASRHVGDPYKQTLETLDNMTALIAHAEQLHGISRKEISRSPLFKVYIRRPEHLSLVNAILKQQISPSAQVLCLQGEICRSELLLEIEGILTSER